jgi:hypothetical protein
MFCAAYCMISRPVTVSPVKEIFARRGFAASALLVRWWVLPDVVQCIPQQTAPDRTGKGRIGARLITNADNTRRTGISPPARVEAS